MAHAAPTDAEQCFHDVSITNLRSQNGTASSFNARSNPRFDITVPTTPPCIDSCNDFARSHKANGLV